MVYQLAAATVDKDAVIDKEVLTSSINEKICYSKDDLQYTM